MKIEGHVGLFQVPFISDKFSVCTDQKGTHLYWSDRKVENIYKFNCISKIWYPCPVLSIVDIDVISNNAKLILTGDIFRYDSRRDSETNPRE